MNSLLPAQTTAPVDPRVAMKIEGDLERGKILQQLSAATTIGPYRLSDVVGLTTQHGHLFVTTKVATAGPEAVVRLDQLPGINTLLSRTTGKKDGRVAESYSPGIFLLVNYRFDNPDRVVASTTVEQLPQSTQISFSSETMDTVTQLNLTDRFAVTGTRLDPVPAGVTLKVTVLKKDADNAETIELSAADFDAFRREHPLETDRYLRPVLEQLHADESALSLDNNLAWQVFSPEIKPPAALTGQVNQLLKQLDAEAYADRESAGKKLEALGPIGAVVLSRVLSGVDRSTLSPEQAGRVDAVLRAFHPASEQTAASLRHDKAFLIDCLQATDATISTLAKPALEKEIGSKVDFDPAAGAEAEAKAIRDLRRRWVKPLNAAS